MAHDDLYEELELSDFELDHLNEDTHFDDIDEKELDQIVFEAENFHRGKHSKEFSS